MLPPMSLSLSKIRVMTLHVAARTNILLVTWQEDLAPPQPPEQPRLEGEGAPAGEVSAATAPLPLWATPCLCLAYWAPPGRISPLPLVVLELPCKEPITVPTFLSCWTKTSSVLVFCHFLILGIFHEWQMDRLQTAAWFGLILGCKCTYWS